MSQRIESYTTIDAARQRFPTNNRATPSCQFAPATKTMPDAAAAPTQARPPRSCFLWWERSAQAPTIGSKTAEINVVQVITYSGSDPGETGIPRIRRSVRHGSAGVPGAPHAAVSATDARYGLNSTVKVVVT